MAHNDQGSPLGEFAAAFKELMELQKKIDDSARRIVNGAKILVTHRAEYSPVRASDYPDHDAAYYDGTGADLGYAGVRTIGDFEDLAFSRRHPDKKSFVRLGVAENGTTGAIWFVLGASRSLALYTWLEDGRTVITTRSPTESHYPRPPETLAQHVGPDVTTADVMTLHRRRVTEAGGVPRVLSGLEDLLAAFAAHEEATARFREGLGLGLFEPMLRKKMGDRYADDGAAYVAAIMAHPEWWTGETPRRAESPEAPRMTRVRFLGSRDDDGRLHLTTVGLMMRVLPELQMKRVAANHCRAARFLMGVVARKLIREVPHGPVPPNLELTLTRGDVTATSAFVKLGRYPEVEEGGPARVRLVLEAFSDKRGLLSIFRSEPELLHLVPSARYSGDKDQWLCEMCRRLGQDAPAPLPRERLESEMQAASRKAREALGEFRSRFQRGLGDNHAVVIKVGLAAKRGGREYVWIRVRDWQSGGAIAGTLVSEPRDVEGLTRGQEMRVPEADVFDCGIYSKTVGIVEGGLTDIVAHDFGVDL